MIEPQLEDMELQGYGDYGDSPLHRLTGEASEPVARSGGADAALGVFDHDDIPLLRRRAMNSRM